MTREGYPKLSLKESNSRRLVIESIKTILSTTVLRRLLKKIQQKRKLPAEKFGGIEFVQIHSLPLSQKKIFWQSPISKKIIIILRDKELLLECLPYKDYCDWYTHLEK